MDSASPYYGDCPHYTKIGGMTSTACVELLGNFESTEHGSYRTMHQQYEESMHGLLATTAVPVCTVTAIHAQIHRSTMTPMHTTSMMQAIRSPSSILQSGIVGLQTAYLAHQRRAGDPTSRALRRRILAHTPPMAEIVLVPEQPRQKTRKEHESL
jgi:hypothetical protein